MPEYTEERENYFIECIRHVLVFNRKASGNKVKDLIKKEFELDLDRDYVNKLITKIHEENAGVLNELTVNKAISEYDDFIDIVLKRLKKVVDDSDEDRDIISAIKAMVESYRGAFNLKFDAGVFAKQIGDINIKDGDEEKQKRQIQRVIKELKDAGHDIGA